jgi:hypothetical protein
LKTAFLLIITSPLPKVDASIKFSPSPNPNPNFHFHTSKKQAMSPFLKKKIIFPIHVVKFE